MRASYAFKFGLLFCLLTLDAGTALAQAAVVQGTEFDVLMSDGQGNVQTVQSNVVPLIPGTVCYGWRIRLGGGDKLLKITEIFALPAAPKIWSGEGDQFSPSKITKDRRTSVTTQFFPMHDGWFGHPWCVAPGDPVGAYTIEVYLGQQLLHEFDFTVEKVPGQ